MKTQIFLSFLISFFFFFSEQISPYHHRCIWSDAKITWAKQSEKKKKDHLPKERKMLLLWIDDTTSGRTYVRDYKSNENTIYSKRSKSVWLIKTRCDEEKKNVHDRKIFLPTKCSLFMEREKFAHRTNSAFSSFSLSLSRSLFLLHIRIFAFLYNKRSVRASERV